ncbi:putative immunity protein, partial [Patulibacter sp. S7RM1-6]
MASPQALSVTDRRLVAAWAADCAERALGLFQADAPAHPGPRRSIERARAFACGDLDAAEAIRRRGGTEDAVGPVSAAAAAAAKAAGQAGAVAHMGAHAL